MSVLNEILAEIPLFARLQPDELSRIVEIGRVEYFSQSSVILAEGDDGPRLLVVLEGRVDVQRADATGVQRSISVLGPGEVLGEIALLLDLPRTATVVALEDLKCFTMDRSAFQGMVNDGDPAAVRIVMELARTLGRRVVTLNDRVLELLSSESGMHEQFANERQSLFRLWS